MEGLIAKAGLYPVARDAYQHLLNRGWLAERRALRERFRPYIRPGDLVFDIGANHGHYAFELAKLGGHVVAVEPNPPLAALVKARYGRRLVDVVCAAVADVPGSAVLHLAGDDQHSTLSEQWMSISPETEWCGEVTVPAVTLDDLIDRYGVPSFVKIDAETYDPQVLAGLSRPIRALCFEWVAALPENYQACIDLLAQLGDYEITRLDEGEDCGDAFAVLR